MSLTMVGCGAAAGPASVATTTIAGATAAPTDAAASGIATPASAASSAAPSAAPSATTSVVPSDSPAAALPDPCSLVTSAEAANVAGVKLQAPVPGGDPVDRCVWTSPPTGETAQLEVYVGDTAKSLYDADNLVLKHAFAPVPGIGDEAYAEADAIFFRTGATWVAIHLVRINDASQNAAPLAALARAVAGRV